MSTTGDASKYLVRAEELNSVPREHSATHPLNPNYEVFGTDLHTRCGLETTVVTHLTIPPGKDSLAYHAHYATEEWTYIISGRGIATIGDEDVEVGPGDFMAFPIGVGHHLVNRSEEDLVYLVGRGHGPVEIADFRDYNKRLLRRGKIVQWVDLDAAE